jgi:serine/threonine-protein kinase
MAAAIDHPNVIPVYGAGEEDGRLYLVMRHVRGTDLHRLLRDEGPLDPVRAAAVIAQVAAALDAAHAAGLVHRDVKPANVLLDGRGEHVYLTDFGLTRLEASDTQMTEVGRWLGTVDYAAPEQLEARRVDARSDVYALACVLHAALTGQPPYVRDTVPAAMLAHLEDPPPRPSQRGLPAGFDRVLARGLAKAPDDRYPSAGDLARAAAAAAAGEPVSEVERSVAVGAAAPTAVTRVGDQAPDAPPTALTEAGATAVAGPPTGATRMETASQPRPEAVRVRSRRRARIRAGLLAACVVLAALVALAVTGALGGGDSRASSADPVSDAEVQAVVGRFADAYAAEDAEAMARTLARSVERVAPGDVQRGRRAVVAEYRRQFAGNAIADYTLDDLRVTSGAVGRVEAAYVADRRGAEPFAGRIVFGVVRDAGRVRIGLIAATPEA